jgi:hypothetical protein
MLNRARFFCIQRCEVPSRTVEGELLGRFHGSWIGSIIWLWSSLCPRFIAMDLALSIHSGILFHAALK